MTQTNETEGRERRVASGFPNPDDVPGPTESRRRLPGYVDASPQPPNYGPAPAPGGERENPEADNVAQVNDVTNHDFPARSRAINFS